MYIFYVCIVCTYALHILCVRSMLISLPVFFLFSVCHVQKQKHHALSLLLGLIPFSLRIAHNLMGLVVEGGWMDRNFNVRGNGSRDRWSQIAT
jgi:hypothetical protein